MIPFHIGRYIAAFSVPDLCLTIEFDNRLLGVVEGFLTTTLFRTIDSQGFSTRERVLKRSYVMRAVSRWGGFRRWHSSG